MIPHPRTSRFCLYIVKRVSTFLLIRHHQLKRKEVCKVDNVDGSQEYDRLLPCPTENFQPTIEHLAVKEGGPILDFITKALDLPPLCYIKHLRGNGNVLFPVDTAGRRLELLLILKQVSNDFSFKLLNETINIDGYDSLDPNGNITIKWDLRQQNDGTQDLVFLEPGEDRNAFKDAPLYLEWAPDNILSDDPNFINDEDESHVVASTPNESGSKCRELNPIHPDHHRRHHYGHTIAAGDQNKLLSLKRISNCIQNNLHFLFTNIPR
ncbi:hypothetical protein L2E82_06982 [Cichorium intybus]|uniref:Uncharacterized protein n=1 Tax=Cichorium intybus TaxID=13427 RepID=A0ACB9G3J5_CICIN|nr:hypothetical protein L2E82_06982 [Cichorium intybus]